jgi:DNA polymerase
LNWTKRQKDMLAAMGLRVWGPASDAPTSPAPAAAPAIEERAVEPAPAAVALAEEGAALRPVAPAPRSVAPPRPEAVTRSAGPTARPAPTPSPAALAPQAALPNPELEARAARIATLEWTPLQEAVAACTACGLCASRKQTVFGVGHARAEWMIIGEAPGEQEDLAGEPFVGQAGQLLDRMLFALGLSRADEPTRESAGAQGSRPADADGDPARRVFIANTLKCRPPRNRNPEPDELERCEPFLRRQVELVQPRVILLMGRFAVKTLLKSDEAIGKLRGRVHRYAGIPVIVTYHPAYLLRNLPDKAKAWEDLCLAAATMATARAQAAGS